jgi:hypothetical protein
MAIQFHLSLALEKIFEDFEMSFRFGYILAPGIETMSRQQKSIAGPLLQKGPFHTGRQCLHIL